MNKTMQELKHEVREIIDSYYLDADFEDTILKLASVGYRMEDAMARA